MAYTWYCCGCSFGPHDADLQSTCLECGERRCEDCTYERQPSMDACHELSPYPVPTSTCHHTSHHLGVSPAMANLALPNGPSLGFENVSGCGIPNMSNEGVKTAGGALYICCQCQDGPKLWDNQPKCYDNALIDFYST
ncbi:hypothetical protein AWENTII_003569 [Aspergillus wentii]